MASMSFVEAFSILVAVVGPPKILLAFMLDTEGAEEFDVSPRALEAAGHSPYDWGLGFNLGPTPENFASMAVLRKIGFTFRGMIQLPGIERESTHFTCP